VWRWALAVWTVAVVVGGGLTLWLQDSAEPPPPTGWYEDQRDTGEDTGESPAPLLSFEETVPPCPDEGNGPVAVACAYVRAR